MSSHYRSLHRLSSRLGDLLFTVWEVDLEPFLSPPFTFALRKELFHKSGAEGEVFRVFSRCCRTPLSGIGATCGAVSRVGASQKAEIFSSSTSRNRHTGCVQTALREVRSLNERVSLSLQPDSFSCESSGPKERTQYRDSVFSHSWEAGGW